MDESKWLFSSSEMNGIAMGWYSAGLQKERDRFNLEKQQIQSLYQNYYFSCQDFKTVVI
jgi:hypothetical protein